jgi:hypothetical protein
MESSPRQRKTPLHQSARLSVARGRQLRVGHAPGLASVHAKLEVEITDMEGKTESTEMMDQQGGEENQHDCQEKPEQCPEEARHAAANAHGGQLPANSQSMRAISRKVSTLRSRTIGTISWQAWHLLRLVWPR